MIITLPDLAEADLLYPPGYLDIPEGLISQRGSGNHLPFTVTRFPPTVVDRILQVVQLFFFSHRSYHRHLVGACLVCAFSLLFISSFFFFSPSLPFLCDEVLSYRVRRLRFVTRSPYFMTARDSHS